MASHPPPYFIRKTLQYAGVHSRRFVETAIDESPKASVVFSLLRDHANIVWHSEKTDKEEDLPNLLASKKGQVELR